MLTIDNIFDAMKTVSDRDALMFLSLNIMMERIGSLPKDDKADLFELFNAWRETDDEEELTSIRHAMQEILLQQPVTVRGELPDGGKPFGTARKKWADYAGKIVRELREKAGLTQVKLAAKAKLPQSHVSRIETGEYAPNHITVRKLAAALGVKPGVIDPSL